MYLFTIDSKRLLIGSCCHENSLVLLFFLFFQIMIEDYSRDILSMSYILDKCLLFYLFDSTEKKEIKKQQYHRTLLQQMHDLRFEQLLNRHVINMYTEEM